MTEQDRAAVLEAVEDMAVIEDVGGDAERIAELLGWLDAKGLLLADVKVGSCARCRAPIVWPRRRGRDRKYCDTCKTPAERGRAAAAAMRWYAANRGWVNTRRRDKTSGAREVPEQQRRGVESRCN